MQLYTIKQLTRITALDNCQVEEYLAFVARIIPQGIREDSKGMLMIEDNALRILKLMAEKRLSRYP